MSFADGYLAGSTISGRLIEERPDKNTGIIIIIPAFDEPGIIFTLRSIEKCYKPDCAIELIVLVNAPRGSNDEQLRQNERTLDELSKWKPGNSNYSFKLHYYDTGLRNDRQWGVGMARKMAMDEALRRFNDIDNPGGVIVSLDADCGVAENYLLEIYSKLYLEEKRKACSIGFEHPLSGDLSDDVYSAVSLYELHLRYYYQALKYTGFPHVFHTIGSAIAVKANVYAGAGGMSKKKGAEDFYFIQKIIPAGGYFYLNSTCVYPSPRPSARVPFGTGPVISGLLEQLNQDYFSYSPDAFKYLKVLFSNTGFLYKAGEKDRQRVFMSLHPGLQMFLEANKWSEKLNEIEANTSSEASFIKRFFNWFNMFRVVKYLNYSHNEAGLKKIPVMMAASEILKIKGSAYIPGDPFDMLRLFREMESQA